MTKTEYTPKRKWRIECTEEKLRLIADMVEDVTRFIGGQPQLMNCLMIFPNGNEIGEYMRDNVRPMMNLGCDCDCVGWDGRNTTNKYVRKEVAQGYATYKSILAALANEYDWHNVHSGTPLTCEHGGELMNVRPVDDSEPEINTFEDLKEAGKMANMFASTTVWKNPEDEREVDFTTECGDSPAERKALATLKIAQLIDVAYGGIVTADEHQYDEAWVYAITYDHNSKHYPFEIILAEKSHDLLSFHSADYDNAERFLCYNEDLVRDFYMMPRKEDEK